MARRADFVLDIPSAHPDPRKGDPNASVGAETLDVMGFGGTEGISTMYHFNVTLLERLPQQDATPQVDFDKMLDQQALLVVHADRLPNDAVIRYFFGVISRIECTGVGTGYAMYSAELASPFYRLGLRRDTRFWQKKTTKEIVDEILHSPLVKEPVTITWDLETEYKPRDYCCQYRESDLDFFQRLLEEEGISYHFKHSESALEMILTDKQKREQIEGNPQIHFSPASGFTRSFEYISSFGLRQMVQPGKVQLREYGWENAPQKPDVYEAQSSIQHVNPEYELYDYPAQVYRKPEHFIEPGLGQRLVDTHIQRIESVHKVGQGTSRCQRFVPGYTFVLGSDVEGPSFHGAQQLDINQEYLLVSVNHSAQHGPDFMADAGASGATYSNRFVAMPATLHYRPPRSHVKPRVPGIHTACVIGPRQSVRKRSTTSTWTNSAASRSPFTGTAISGTASSRPPIRARAGFAFLSRWPAWDTAPFLSRASAKKCW